MNNLKSISVEIRELLFLQIFSEPPVSAIMNIIDDKESVSV